MNSLRQRLDDLRWQTPSYWWWPVRRRGGRDFGLHWAHHGDITAELASHGVRVEPYTIDVDAFWAYVEEVGYRSSYYYHGGTMTTGAPDGDTAETATEKWLEHYVSWDLIRPERGETLIDIASCHSPFADMQQDHYGITAYRQDLMFPAGLHDDRTIGGDAAAMPVDDGFADLMTLHCSFEHFEGDSDRRFVREAQRVLRPGGRLCILPLYTSTRYSIQSDPATWAEQPVRFEPDAKVCLARGWSEAHGRLYDAAHFLDRVVANLGPLELTVYAIENAAEVSPNCYLRFAALLRQPGADA